MLTTRGVKRSTTFAEVDLDRLELWEDEELWRQEEQTNKNKRKKSVRLFCSNLDATFRSLPPEILPRILGYVDDVGDLLRLSRTTKAFRSSITDEVILRLCVSGKGATKQQKTLASVCDKLMDKVAKGSIHPPSTFRLLRLFNADRCERGDKCYGFDMKDRVACRLRPLTSSCNINKPILPFGMAICKTCIPYVSGNFDAWRWRWDDSQPLWSTKICMERLYTYRGICLLDPAEEVATGDAIGPYVQYLPVKQIESTFEDTIERVTAVNKLLTDVEKRKRPEERERSFALLEIYQALKDELEGKRIAKSTNIEELEAKRMERAALKRSRVDHWKSYIENLLEGYEHKHLVLRGHFIDYSGEYRFDCELSRDTIGKVLRAPTTANKDKIIKAVSEMKELFSVLLANGFGTDNPNKYLLSFLRESDAPAEKALYNYRLFLGSAWTQRHSFWLYYARTNFVRQIRESNSLQAFLKEVRHTNVIRDAFVHEMTLDEVDDNFKTLATKTWESQCNSASVNPSTAASYRLSFNRCKRKYDTLAMNMKTYLRLTPVQRFLEETSVPASHAAYMRRQRGWPLTRRQILSKFFKLENGSCEFLHECKFNELLALHKLLFQNPDLQRR